MKENRLVVFQDKRIRRILVDDEWFFSVVDVVAALTDKRIPVPMNNTTLPFCFRKKVTKHLNQTGCFI